MAAGAVTTGVLVGVCVNVCFGAGIVVVMGVRVGKRFHVAQRGLRIERGVVCGDALADDRRDNGKPHGGDAEPCDEAIARVTSHESVMSAEAQD